MIIRPIKAIENFFNSRTDSQLKEWIDSLNILGFDKIAFPILIISGHDLSFVSLTEFAIDPDLHFHKFDSFAQFIDSEGQLWNWKYDTKNQTNLPGTYIRTMNFEEVKKMINDGLVDNKHLGQFKPLIDNSETINELFIQLTIDLKL